LQTIFLGWLQNLILLISSWIGRITGVSHWLPGYTSLSLLLFVCLFRCWKWAQGLPRARQCTIDLHPSPMVLLILQLFFTLETEM
jgi:hypothetical protein